MEYCQFHSKEVVMKNRNSLLTVILLVLILIITGCSSGDQSKNTDGGGSDSDTSAVETEELDSLDANSEESDNPDGEMEVSVAANGLIGAELPDGYPQDKFPLYEKSYIGTALKQDGSYTVLAFSKDEAAKVTKFYADVLKDAAVIAEGETDGHFTSFGTISGYSYQIDIGGSDEMEGYQTSVTIVLIPKM